MSPKKSTLTTESKKLQKDHPQLEHARHHTNFNHSQEHQTRYITTKILLTESLPLDCPSSAHPVSVKVRTLLFYIIAIFERNLKIWPSIFYTISYKSLHLCHTCVLSLNIFFFFFFFWTGLRDLIVCSILAAVRALDSVPLKFKEFYVVPSVIPGSPKV